MQEAYERQMDRNQRLRYEMGGKQIKKKEKKE